MSLLPTAQRGSIHCTISGRFSKGRLAFAGISGNLIQGTPSYLASSCRVNQDDTSISLIDGYALPSSLGDMFSECYIRPSKIEVPILSLAEFLDDRHTLVWPSVDLKYA